MVRTGSDVGFAFGLSFAAGLSTCVGGFVILFKCLTKFARPSTLGIALGVSAGVMIFISLTEIFNMSVKYFQKGFASSIGTAHRHAGLPCDSTCKGHGWAAASASFLLGLLIIYALDFIVHKMSPGSHEEEENFGADELNALQDVEKAEEIKIIC